MHQRQRRMRLKEESLAMTKPRNPETFSIFGDDRDPEFPQFPFSLILGINKEPAIHHLLSAETRFNLSHLLSLTRTIIWPVKLLRLLLQATRNTNTNRTMAQYNADARLMVAFEQSGVSGKSFNYSRSVSNALRVSSTEEQMNAYLSRMLRGGLVQSFGCLLAIEEPNFEIIAYSENCFDMLGLRNIEPMGLIGKDTRTFFTPSSRASLEQAIKTREISFSNPIWVHSRTNHKSFYAILHRIDVGTVIDLEPTHTGDPVTLHAGAVQYQKASREGDIETAVTPGGDIGALCDTVVEDVQKLKRYDRVMVYKFHEDNHGEVLSEIRSDLELYLGLHYPATDIPQAARFPFKQNRVRLISDCNAQPVKIIQKEELKQSLCLVNSTLRSPHDCHSVHGQYGVYFLVGDGGCYK